VTRQAPGRVSCRIVELAARTLPAAHRERYRREFTAELYFLPPSQQVRHATQVMSQAWALRAALGRPAPGTQGETTVRNRPARPRHEEHDRRVTAPECHRLTTALGTCGGVHHLRGTPADLRGRTRTGCQRLQVVASRRPPRFVPGVRLIRRG
jgi:hypothetical protein